ncbi:MAG: cytochrome P460 family protein [Desulfatibacillaceae bacterium]
MRPGKGMSLTMGLLAAAILLTAGVTVAGMHEEAKSRGTVGGDMQLPPPDAQKLWTYITEENPYEKWDHWPGYDGMYKGQSPHGAYLKLYANDVAIRAAQKGEPMPHGAILVKENYAGDKETLAAITPMYKVKGFNPDAQDWFWAKYGPGGSVGKAGDVYGCINCHRGEKDMIFSRPK